MEKTETVKTETLKMKRKIGDRRSKIGAAAAGPSPICHLPSAIFQWSRYK
jgi:hypothetical protein